MKGNIHTALNISDHSILINPSGDILNGNLMIKSPDSFPYTASNVAVCMRNGAAKTECCANCYCPGGLTRGKH